MIIYEDGSRYVGAFRDSTYNGIGTYTYADGSEWTGEWQSGKNINGEGVVKYDNGEKWEGEYKDGKRNGKGTYTYPDQKEYVGEYFDDERLKRYLSYPGWEKYIGQWKDGPIMEREHIHMLMVVSI